MTKTLTALGLIAALALPASTASALPHSFCEIVSDDAAYIMGVRQRGEPMTGVLDAINWMKYRAIDSDMHIEMAGIAWNEPIWRSSADRQRAVRDFATTFYNVCRATR